MGRIGEIVKIQTDDKLVELTSEPEAGTGTSSVLYNPPGDDSRPLPGDFSGDVEATATGEYISLGVVDSKSAPVATDGEVRRYARNADGATVCQIHLKNSGDVVITNDNGTVTLQADGTLNANGATIDTDGNVSDTVGSLDALRQEFNNFVDITYAAHAHLAPPGGGNTGPPLPS